VTRRNGTHEESFLFVETVKQQQKQNQTPWLGHLEVTRSIPRSSSFKGHLVDALTVSVSDRQDTCTTIFRFFDGGGLVSLSTDFSSRRSTRNFVCCHPQLLSLLLVATICLLYWQGRSLCL
jgi:hypothetical protein